MRPRLPRFRSFSVALGIFVGTAAAAFRPWLWPAAPANAVEIGILVTILGWAVAEQVHEQLDHAVTARLHWSLAVVGALPLAGVLGAHFLTEYTASAGVLLRAAAFVFAGLVATSCGSGRYAEILRETRPVRGNVIAIKSKLYEVPLTLVSSAVGLTVVRFVLEGSISVDTLSFSLVGMVIGTLVAMLLVGEGRIELVALDDCLLVKPERHVGGSVVQWRRIRDVDIDGDTLRVTRGLPWPMVYEADLSTAVHPETVSDAFRSKVRSP